MKTRTVAPVVLGLAWAAGLSALADEPARPGSATATATATDSQRVARVSPTSHATQATAVKPPKRVPIEDVALQLGVSVPELQRLRRLGFADAETASLLHYQRRSAHDLILEREVLNAVSKAVDEANAQVFQLSPKQQGPERDRLLKASLAKIRRDHNAGRDEFRRILSVASYFNADDLKRLIGSPSFFNVDDLNLKRTSLFGQ